MLFLSGWFIYVCLMCPLIMSHCNAFLTLRSLWDLNENTWKATKYRILKFVRVIALHWELQLELRPWPPIDSDTKLCEMYEFMAEGNTSNGQRRASLPLCSPSRSALPPALGRPCIMVAAFSGIAKDRSASQSFQDQMKANLWGMPLHMGYHATVRTPLMKWD